MVEDLDTVAAVLAMVAAWWSVDMAGVAETHPNGRTVVENSANDPRPFDMVRLARNDARVSCMSFEQAYVDETEPS